MLTEFGVNGVSILIRGARDKHRERSKRSFSGDNARN